jgi:hypothetical protein
MLRRALLLVPSVLRSCRLSAALDATTTSADSSRARTREVSPGKVLNFPLGPSGSTCSVLMRFGFRVCQHADRPLPASLPIRVPMVAGLPAASFSSTLAGVALRFSYGCSHQLRCHRFMSLVKAHAGHTSKAVPALSPPKPHPILTLLPQPPPQRPPSLVFPTSIPQSQRDCVPEPKVGLRHAGLSWVTRLTTPIPTGLRPKSPGWTAARRPTRSSPPPIVKPPSLRLRPHTHAETREAHDILTSVSLALSTKSLPSLPRPIHPQP